MSEEAKPESEYLDLHRALMKLESRLDSTAAILEQLEQLPAWRRKYSVESTAVGSEGPVTWAQHEHLAWALGESIRQALKARRSLRKQSELWTAVESVARDLSVGKGREPFVMLLGQYGGPARRAPLLELLDDPEVVGHALLALRLQRSTGAEAKAAELLTHRRAWIRSEARKYLKFSRPAA